MNYRVSRSSEAALEIRKLSPHSRRAVREAMRDLHAGPTAGDTKQLQGHDDLWRVRAGRWRIIFRLLPSAPTIRILRVRPRATVYDDLDELARTC